MSFHNLSISVLKVGRQMVSYLAIAAFFSGCIKEENPVPPHIPGEVITASVEMGTDYRWQLYYNLEKNEIVGKNLKWDWDLAFETKNNVVHLNASKFMFGMQTSLSTFGQVNDTTGFEKNKRWDASNTPDSLLIGGNVHDSNIYILDLGYDDKGEPAGFKKVKMVGADAQKYVMQYADMNSSEFKTIEIQRDTNYTFSYFSFKTATQVKIAPPKKDWDMVFTQYIHIFYEPYQPYLVTGVLLNPYQTYASSDTILYKRDTYYSFEKMDYKKANEFKFSAQPDGIGYNWKSFGSLGAPTSNYTVFPHTYLVKNSKSMIYKLRFIKFYDSQGRKGTPTFEFAQL